MPIPSPQTNESRDEFMTRCMSDSVMVDEYEPAQRYAVCNSKWREKQDDAARQDRKEG